MNDLVAMLERAVDAAPERVAFEYADGIGSPGVTYASLHILSGHVAAHLAHRHAMGDRVALVFEDPVDAIIGFFGCQRAGLIAVPIAYPGHRSERADIFQHVMASCGARTVLTSDSLARRHEGILHGTPVVPLSQAIDPQASDASGLRGRRVDTESVAYLQYTSGSVGLPKGVIVRQRHVLANVAQIADRFQLPQGVSTVSWLPYFHDQGLVGGLLVPLHRHGTCWTMSPSAFVKRPMHWIETISDTRAVFSGGPNFAYALCAQAVERDGPRGDLDLSAWSAAFNGAEKVQASTLERFRRAFAPSGLRADALAPCYGLAEATLAVTIPVPGYHPDSSAELVDVPCGEPVDGAEVAIVDADSQRRLEEGALGEIWVRGPMVASGYWNDELRSTERFNASIDDDTGASGFLRTGDLGYLRQGQLHVVSRRDDLIIVRGANHYPADIEHTLSSCVPLLASATTAAIGLPDGSVHLIVELSPSALRRIDRGSLHTSLVQFVSLRHGLVPDGIWVARKAALPKTTSGKVQRHRCRELVGSDSLEPLLGIDPATGVAHAAGDIVQARIAALVESLGLRWTVVGDEASLLLDSLDALRVGHAIESAMGCSLRVGLLVGKVTLAALADAVAESAGEIVDTGDAFALTPYQRDVWMADRLVPRPAASTLGFTSRLPDGDGHACLRQVVDAACRANPSWNARLEENTTGEAAFVPLAGDVSIEQATISDEALDGAEAEWLGRPFLTATGPLVRVVLWTTPTMQVAGIAAHHLVSDEVSLRLLLAALVGHGDDGIGSSPGYRRFVAWSASYDATGDADWWRGELRDAEDFLSLRRMKPATLVDHRVCEEHASFDEATCVAIEHAASAKGRTVASWLLACYAAAIAGYSGKDDIVVACPVSLRSHEVFRQAIGSLINTVPVRVVVDGRDLIDACWARVDGALREARRHARFASRDILRQSTLDREDTLSPLGRAVFNFVDARDDGALATGSVRHVRRPQPHADVYLTVERHADGMRLDLSMYGERHDRDFVHAFLALVTRMASKAGGAADASLSVLRADASASPPSAGPAAMDVRHPRLDDAFTAACALHTARTALRWKTARGEWAGLDYPSLDRLVAALASRLVVEPVGTVGVMMARSPKQIVAILAALRAGHAWMPLDPALPAGRVESMLQDCGCRIVVTGAGIEPSLPAGIQQVPYDRHGFPHETPDNAGTREPSPVAAVIFTSGSTGRPKGVAVPHAAYMNRLAAMSVELGVVPTDVFLQKTTFAFDVSVWEMFLPLIHGATLVLADPADVRDPRQLDALIDEAGIHIVHFVPTQLQSWLDLRDRSRELPALRACLCSGESLQSATRDDFRTSFPTARLVNLYGPTECAIDVTCMDVTATTGTPPIGRATAGVDAYLVDACGDPVPDGVAGELCIGGIQIALGYVGRTGLTAERFVPCPFQPGRRMYATGDRAYRDHAGTLHYLGRADDQVKLHGQRIELGEIINVARARGNVSDAVAVLLDRDGSPALGLVVAMVDERGVAAFDAQGLRDRMAEHLPSYMLPRFIRATTGLPVTSNGKCDVDAVRRLLAEAVDSHATTGDGLDATVADAWSRSLGVSIPSPDIDFFRLGGDSILAIRLIAALAEQGLTLSMTDVYTHRTPRSQASLLSRQAIAGGRDAEPAPYALLSPRERAALPPGVEDAYPLSMLQRSIVFQAGQASYESYVSHVRVKGPLRLSALQAAVNRVVASHPFLRSAFDLDSAAEPLQVVFDHAMTTVRLHDLRDMAPRESDDAVDHWRRGELRRGFTWNKAPLLRFTVHALSADEFVLHMTDAALDGWCVATVLSHVMVAYDAELAGVPAPAPPAGASYARFVALEREAMRSPIARAFWDERVAGQRPSQLAEKTPSDETARERLVLPLDESLVDAARQLADAAGTPLRSVFLAAYTRCVEAWSGKPGHVSAGLEFNGRPEVAGGDLTVGVFNNIVAWSIDTRATDAVDLVRSVFEEERRILPHRRYPYAELIAGHGPRAAFDALFVYTDFHVLDSLASLAHCEVRDVSATDQTYIPLTFHLNHSGLHGGYRLVLDVDTGRVPVDRARAIPASFVDHLSRLCANHPAPAAVVPPILLADRPEPIHALLDGARRYPHATAVVGAGESLDYATLARRVRQRADELRSHSLGEGSRVALLGPTDIAFMIALLACWHEGACVVLLDPDDLPRRVAERANRCDALCVLDDGIPGDIQVPLLRFAGTPEDRDPVDRAPTALVDTTPAYVIHTSGSTGASKGVVVGQGALWHYLRWASARYGFGPETTVWNHSAMAQDFTLTTFVAPLLGGATVRCVPRGDLAAVLALSEADDVLKLTPSHLGVFRQLIGSEAAPRGFPRRVIMGGEVLRSRDIRCLRAWQPAVRVFNEYGPTETCVGCSVHECEAIEDDACPIGEAVEAASLHVLDDHGIAVEGMGTGELYIGGVSLAAGYDGSPAATACAFLPDPFSAQAGARMYRSGDRVSRDGSGELRCLGRIDRQVKHRGHRVDLLEVEAAIVRLDGVQAVAADLSDDVLTCWLVVSDEMASIVRDRIDTALAPSMRPDRVVRVAHLPVGHAGKVDMSALRQLRPLDAKPVDTTTLRLLARLELMNEDAAAILLDQLTKEGTRD